MSIIEKTPKQIRLAAWKAWFWWCDKDGARMARIGVAVAAVFLAGAYTSITIWMPAQERTEAVVWWVYAIWIVVAAVVMMALAPKPKAPEIGEAKSPQVEDGAGVPMVFGTQWIEGTLITAHKFMGTDNIRGKKSGFSSRPIIGYWYKQAFQFEVCRGPIDVMREIRGGDKPAWTGLMEDSGRISINKPMLWGGDKTGGEGGIVTAADIRFGRELQMPSAYLAANIGPNQPAGRGLFSVIFEGGRYGAFSPYPKTVAFKLTRIMEGWEGSVWEPALAEVPMGHVTPLVWPETFQDGLQAYTATAGSKARFSTSGTTISTLSTSPRAVIRRVIPQENIKAQFSSIAYEFRLEAIANGDSGVIQIYDANGVYIHGFNPRWGVTGLPLVGYNSNGGPTATMGDTPLSAGVWYRYMATFDQNAGQLTCRITRVDTGVEVAAVVLSGPALPMRYLDIWAAGDASQMREIQVAHTYPTMVGMNPAHILYQSVTDSWLGGEPEASINPASFAAAAAVFYSEGLGLATAWIPGSETVEAFQQRICNAAGCSISRSTIDGRWQILPIRSGADIDSLPILTDDDIIQYAEDPASLEEAVNQVTVEWFDPEAKESRSTAPVQSLGGIRRSGGVIAEVVKYREVPLESLALRLASRDLFNRSQPQRRMTIVTTPITRYWTSGQRFRLQAPRRGIVDMVCRLGDISGGTLRSGAIQLVASQDVFGMPTASYVAPSPPPPAPAPEVASFAGTAAGEAPYIILARGMPAGDFAALQDQDGFVMAVAAPAGQESDFTMWTDAGAGLQEADNTAWCSTAIAGPGAQSEEPTVVAFTHYAGQEAAVIGQAVLWGDEVCRLAGIDLVAGTVTLDRGCADTPPIAHDAGDRLWFLDEDVAIDPDRRTIGQEVVVALQANMATGSMELEDAPRWTITLQGRQARPYAPGRLRINGDAYPTTVIGVLEVSWAPRNRVTQGADLVDASAVAVAAEPGTTWTVRAHQGGVQVYEQDGITGTTHEVGMLAADGSTRVEVWAETAGKESWRATTADINYLQSPHKPYADESGAIYADESGTTYEG